jgi:hypothetical protein
MATKSTSTRLETSLLPESSLNQEISQLFREDLLLMPL